LIIIEIAKESRRWPSNPVVTLNRTTSNPQIQIVLRPHANLSASSLKELLSYLKKVIVKGIPGILRCNLRQLPRPYLAEDESLRLIEHSKVFDQDIRGQEWVVDTSGSNLLEIMMVPGVDNYRTFTNDIHEIYELMGVEAARSAIIQEYHTVMTVSDKDAVGRRHLRLLADKMTHTGVMLSVARHGLKKGTAQPLSRATFEETMTQMVDASILGEVDKMNGVSPNIMFGQFIKAGTNSFGVMLDEEMVEGIQNTEQETPHLDLDRTYRQLQRKAMGIANRQEALQPLFINVEFAP
jgi:DNA-directed RNA polymerase beta' subunit